MPRVPEAEVRVAEPPEEKAEPIHVLPGANMFLCGDELQIKMSLFFLVTIQLFSLKTSSWGRLRGHWAQGQRVLTEGKGGRAGGHQGGWLRTW